MLTRYEVEKLVFQKPNLCGVQRFTQDSPVLPDVWFAFAKPFVQEEHPPAWPSTRVDDVLPAPQNGRLDLLLNPHRDSNADLFRRVAEGLRQERNTFKGAPPLPSGLTYNESFVVVKMRLRELIRIVLPLTGWWANNIVKSLAEVKESDLADILEDLRKQEKSRSEAPQLPCRPNGRSPYESGDLLWLVRLAGWLAWEYNQQDLRTQAGTADGRKKPSRGRHAPNLQEPTGKEVAKAFLELVRGLSGVPEDQGLVWSVSLNRPVRVTVQRSVVATKADAARLLFNIKCHEICWAVVDSGIDARHPAFWKRPEPEANPAPTTPSETARKDNGNKIPPESRVVAMYDFTRFRDLLGIDVAGDTPGGDKLEEVIREKKNVLTLDQRRRIRDCRRALKHGRYVDWAAIEPLLKVELDPNGPPREVHPHGTHVAGILAGNWCGRDDPAPPDKQGLRGMCPDLRLCDFRVLGLDGAGDEYSILAALQFIRWLNANKDEPLIHGVNLSLSLPHDVANFACGQTPICEECERLVNSGVIVVVAAGNEGRTQFTTPQGGITAGYRGISITDPGNAEAVITVGATHRFKPHTYGVSYFSSRGPTGDGRCKPDIVAPGEKIVSCMPEGHAAEMDGTSMAAPHVSGAAALLLARHRELMKKPARVKQILCETATDLGRERFFQGHGMVDVLRAIQSI
jgi:serine protease AprX